MLFLGLLSRTKADIQLLLIVRMNGRDPYLIIIVVVFFLQPTSVLVAAVVASRRLAPVSKVLSTPVVLAAVWLLILDIHLADVVLVLVYRDVLSGSTVGLGFHHSVSRSRLPLILADRLP